MADFKEYRSVTEFPANAENLTQQELIENYEDLRETYKSLTSSRGQLVRRQREAKEKNCRSESKCTREKPRIRGKRTTVDNRFRKVTNSDC
jgi:hypothetical protein